MALRQLRTLVNGLHRDRVKSLKQRKRINNRHALAERLEDRRMLAGPELIAIRPDAGALLRDGDTLTTAPSEFNLLFKGGADLDEATINSSSIRLIRSGNDGLFDGINDVAVRLGYVGLVNPGSTDPLDRQQIVVRPASSAAFNSKSLSDQFPDDLYQIQIVGSGALTANTPLQNLANEAFNSGVDFVSTFRLDRGAQVLSVVPQPVTRNGGVLSQATNQIDVYFDNQRLDSADAQNVAFYRLVNAVTLGPSTTPTAVTYDPSANKATLTFAAIPQGSYRLDIGQAVDNDAAVDNRGSLGIADASSSFDTAVSIGNVGTATIKISGRIEPQSIPLPPLPGGEDDPGHRKIQREAHIGATGTTPAVPSQIQTVEYYFPTVIGTFDTSSGPGTGAYLNLITETEKQIVRDIFELYAKQAGIEFIENQGVGSLSIGKGDLRAINPFIGPNAGVAGLGGPSEVVLNGTDFNDSNRYYGDSFTVTMYHEIGHALALGHSYDQPSVQGAAPIPNEVLPGDVDILHLKRISPPNSTDIDFYSFTLPSNGRLNAELFAERLPTPSLLNGTLSLYRRSPATGGGFVYELLAGNDQYFGADAFLDLQLAAGTYFLGVSSTGNTSYDPNVPNSGFGGTTDGQYELALSFKTDSAAVLRDTRGTALDGDADGTPGGVFHFWFQSAAPGNTFFVDKLADTNSSNTSQGLGTLASPFESISQGLAAAAARVGTSVTSPTIVRIVGNGGTDGNLATLGDNRPYLVGTTSANVALADGAEFRVPQGVNVVIDAGTLIKLRKANLDVGSSSAGVNRAGGSIQVLGTPTHSVFLRSYHDDSVGGNSDGVGPGVSSGDFGGIVFRDDSDRESNGIFLNYVNHADIKHGGGKVFVDSAELPFTSIHITNARPTVTYNLISLGNTAAISASPDSFEDSIQRVGPDVYGNYLVDNSIDGMFVRIDTPLGSNITKLQVSGRFDDTDITHVLSENLIIAGGSGGPIRDGFGVLRARPAGRLQIDPGVVLKLNKSRIEAERGAATLIAEGTVDRPVVFTSQTDKRYGGSGSFDTNRSPNSVPAPGDWGGLFFSEATAGSIDQAIITFGGGISAIEGSAFPFNAIEIHQADVRIANSLIQSNAATAASSTSNRNGRGSNGIATIYVRGAQPIIVNNTIADNVGSAIDINANSFKAEIIPDRGRVTGLHDAFSSFEDNYGPLVRLNRLENNGSMNAMGVVNGVNGILVRGEEVTVESVWDDTDIVHVLLNEITVDNLHSLGGLTLQSSNAESLVIKLSGAAAGLTATGTPAEIVDRIGGTIHVLGTVGHPVVFTSLSDDTVGAGFTSRGFVNKDTNNNAAVTSAVPGNWRGLVFDEFSNDRNVAIVRELENPITNRQSVNSTPSSAQFLGVLAPNVATATNPAPNQKSGDENRRLGFEVHGFISPDDGKDVDVYSFTGTSGTPIWIDIDRTDSTLDAVVEVINATTGAALAVSSGPTTGAATLTQNPRLGGDFYSQNYRDPGLHYVLPGTVGSEGTFFVRVSSNSAVPAGNAQSRGKYQLQVRTQQVDEFPGSTVRYADIRFAATGIDVRGLPAHSPLIGEAGELLAPNDTFASAQTLVNLLQTDAAAIGISGELANAIDVDWYEFELKQTGVQAIANGVNSDGGTVAVVFDIDYADGAVSADTTIAVYDENQQLVYIGRESNVDDDQRPNGVTGINDLSRGSLAKKDGYIGPIHLSPGLDPLSTKRYFVAVMSNRQMPTALTGVFTAAVSDATARVRLEPVNSVTRIVEDHIGFQGYASGGAKASLRSALIRGSNVAPSTPGGLFDIRSTAALAANIKPFTLKDVALYVATDVVGTTGSAGINDSLYTVDPSTSRSALTRVTNTIVTGGFNDVQDIVVRSDGRMFGYQRLSGNAGSVGALVEINPETGVATLVGNDNIRDESTTLNLSSFNTNVVDRANQFTTSSDVDALTFQRLSTILGTAPNYDVYYSVREGGNSKLYRARLDGDATPTLSGAPTQYGFLGDIQPAGVTFASGTFDVTDNATPNVTTQVQLESKIPGTAGNAVSVNIAVSRAATAAVNITRSGSTINLEIVRTPATGAVTGGPTAADIVDAINNHPTASQLITALILGNGAGGNGNGGTVSFNSPSAGPVSLSGGSQGAAAPLVGNVTGLAFTGLTAGSSALFGVTAGGQFVRINEANGRATVLNTISGENFQGLALGPQNVEGGAYANTLFAMTTSGRLYAFNTSGALQPIFAAGANFINVSGMTADSASPIGLAFSPLDFNLWHPTTRRGNDVGHGVNPVNDGTRNPADEPITIGSPGDVDRDSNQINGGASLQFGFEPWLADNLKDQNTQSYLTFGTQNAQYGILNELIHADLSTNSAISGSYNFPAGALGAMETKTFSLASTNAADRPTLYFTYFLETQNAPGTLENAANPFQDSARVWARRSPFSQWELLATNNSQLSGNSPNSDPRAELPGFLSHLSDAGLNTGNQRSETVQLRQELFDSSGQWRQARVDLSSFAGSSSLQLRFDFSTAGAFNDSSLGSIDTNFGEFSSTTRSIRSLNNDFEGFYIDDIIIGYAERGEMVTGASADVGITDLNVSDRTRDKNPNRNLNILNGLYQLEVRRSSDYGSYNEDSGATRIFTTYVTNTRHITDLVGSGLLADRNREREQGAFIIESNFITDSSLRGINVQPGTTQGAGGGMPHPGSLINFPQTNADRLIPGVVIQNNVIVDAATGIRFVGETTPTPQRPVPFGRIVNNTIVGANRTGIGVDIVGIASPTLLNNVFTNLGTSINNGSTAVLNGSEAPIIRANFFQNNASNPALGTGAIDAGNTGSPFVDAANGNYYLIPGSQAVDSSQAVEQDRADYSTFKLELGIPNSPIIAPDRDVFGQLRIDSSGSTTGGGSSVFKDRGAVDRSDNDPPYAVLLNPIDNDAPDRDSSETVVQLTNPLLENFRILLGDGRGANAPFEGTGINGLTVSDPVDVTVAARAVRIVHNGRTLVQDVDYILGYNSQTGVLLLTPLSTLWEQTGVYTITLDNTQIADLAGNRLRSNQTDGTTKFFVLMPDVRLDFGDAPDSFSTRLASNAARHTIQRGATPRLGGRIDSESDALIPPGSDDLRQAVVLGTNAPTLFDTTGTTANGGIIVVSTTISPVGGEQITVTIGTRTATFELVAAGFAPQRGNVSVPLQSGDTPSTIAARLAAAINAGLVDEGRGSEVAVDAMASNTVTVETFDDEDGVAIGRYDNGTENHIVFLNPGAPEFTTDPADVLGFLNPLDELGTALSINASSTGLLDAWIDFNGDGAFGIDEQIFADQSLAVGNNALRIVTPLNTANGERWARFRISEFGNLGPDQLATGGEVEDYLVEVINVPPTDPADDTFAVNEDEVLDTTNVATFPGSLFTNDSVTGFLPPRYIVNTLPTNGTLTVADPLSGRFVYTPAPDYYGRDTFTYWVSTQPIPGTIVPPNVELATVTINVVPVNDAPLAVNRQFPALEDSSVNVTAAALLAGAVGHNSPDYVSATGATYPWDESNQDATLRIVSINIDGTDYNATSGPIVSSRGSFVLNFAGGAFASLVFTPAQDLNRDNLRNPAVNPPILQSFTFTIEDDGISRDPVTDAPIAGTPQQHTATGTINVAPRNDNPTANTDLVTVGAIGNPSAATAWRQYFVGLGQPVPQPTEDITLTIPAAFLLQNDLAGSSTALDENNFVNGNDVPLRITSVSVSNRNASVSIAPSGNIVFVPPTDVYGDVVFTYVVTDAGIDESLGGARAVAPRTQTGTVTVTLQPVNDAPVTFGRAFNFSESGAPGVDAPAHVFTATQLLTGSGSEQTSIPGLFAPNLPAPFNEMEQRGTLRVAAFTTAAGTVDGATLVASGGTGTLTLASDNAGRYEFDFVNFAFTSGRFFPRADYNERTPFAATEKFEFIVEDDGATTDPQNPATVVSTPRRRSAPATATITVAATNDAPIFNVALNPAGQPAFDILERDDLGGTVVSSAIVSIFAGPSTALDELQRQGVTFNVLMGSSSVPAGLMAADPTIADDGTLTIFPAIDAVGSAVYVFDAIDNEPGNSTFVPRTTRGTLTVNVRPVNDPPRLNATVTGTSNVTGADEAWSVSNIGLITYTLPEDNAGSGGIPSPYLINARLADSATGRIGLLDVFTVGPANEADGTIGGSQSLRILNVQSTTTQGGTLTVVARDANNFATQIQYTPPANYNSLQGVRDSFTYIVEDDAASLGESWSLSSNGLFENRITRMGRAEFLLNPVNDRPLFTIPATTHSALEDAGNIVVPGFVTGIAAGPATAADETIAQTASFTLTPQTPENGLFTVSPTIAANGTLRYTPSADAVGSVVYLVTLTDTGAANDARGDLNSQGPATITINVRPVNDAPRLNAAVVNTQLSSGPNEAWIVDSAGEITYTLAEDNTQSAGVDAAYVIDVRRTGSRMGLLDPFTVGPSNESDATLGGSQTLRITNLPATTDLGGTLTVLTTDSNGFVTQLSYTPPANYNSLQGPNDSFSYTFEDDANTAGETFDLASGALVENRLSRTSRVQFVLNPLNDAPDFTGAASLTVEEDNTLGGTIGQTIVPNFVTNVVTGPVGADDELVGAGRQTVTFTVTPLSGNTPGLFSATPVVDASGTLSFVTAPDANGVARFTIVANDSGTGTSTDPLQSNTSSTSTFTITVTSVNDAPSFTAGSDFAVAEDSGPYTAATPYATDIIPGPPNEVADGQTVTFTVSVPSGSTSLFAVQPTISPNGFLTFTPADDAVGTVVLNVVAVDNLGASSLPALLTIDITEVNDPPIANNFAIAVDEDNTMVVTQAEFLQLASDPDLQSNPNEVLAITDLMVISAAGAAVSVNNAGDVIYDPRVSTSLQSLRPGQTTTDTFTYRLRDTAGVRSELATVTITVAGRNDKPVAVNDFAVLLSGVSSVLQPLANDSDVDGTLDPATLIITAQPVNGSLSVQSDGSLIYTPRVGFRGQDSIGYTIGDNLGQQSSQATITVDVAPLPVITDIQTGAFFGEPVTIDLRGADVPAGTLDFTSVLIVREPTSGTVTVFPNGTLTYQPDDGFVGNDDFEFTISDRQGRTSTPVEVTVRTVDSRLQNPEQFTDVNASGSTTPLDALLILNHLSRSIRRGEGNTIPVNDTDRGPNFYDASGDGLITTGDALRVINQISRDNRNRLAGGEAETADLYVGMPPAFELDGTAIMISTGTSIEAGAPIVAPFDHGLIAADLLLEAVDEIELLAWDVNEDDDDRKASQLDAFDAAWSDFSGLE